MSNTATHEAAHAVIALSIGLEVASVSLRPGLTILAVEPSAEHGLRFRLAGPVAEELLDGTYDSEGCNSDLVNADRDAWDLTHDLEELDALVARTKAEVRKRLAPLWPDVQRLALALVRHGTLTTAELEPFAPRALREAAA